MPRQYTHSAKLTQAIQAFGWRAALLLFFLFWQGLCQMGHATVPELGNLSNDFIGRSLDILIEDNGPQIEPLTIDQARLRFAEGYFRPSNSKVPKFGIGAPPVWLHLTIDNSETQVQRRRLQIENSWLDRIEVFPVFGDRIIAPALAGDADPSYRHPQAGIGYIFDLELPPGRSDLFIRVETPDPMVLPIRLLDTADAEALQQQYNYGYGILYGCLLALIAYNSMLFISLRERSYFDYALYLGSFVLVHLAYTGHGYAWLWPNNSFFQQYVILLMMVVFSALGLRFASGFLNLHQHAPTAQRVVTWMTSLGLGVGLVLTLLQQQQVLALMVFVFVLIFSLTMVLLGVITIRHGRIAGRYYLAAALTTMIGTSSTALAVWWGLPYTALTFHAAGWGVVIEGILLALALAYRMRHHQRARLEAEQLARTDPLTGLLNRRAFFERALPLWRMALRNRRPLSVMMADIDHFKAINDNHGHAMGDKVLAAVSKCLAEACRSSDVPARWGGEEFVILLSETDGRQAHQLAERLRAEIDDLIIGTARNPIRLTASFGIAERNDHDSLEQLIREADEWLYCAKGNGRNQVASRPLAVAG